MPRSDRRCSPAGANALPGHPDGNTGGGGGNGGSGGSGARGGTAAAGAPGGAGGPAAGGAIAHAATATIIDANLAASQANGGPTREREMLTLTADQGSLAAYEGNATLADAQAGSLSQAAYALE